MNANAANCEMTEKGWAPLCNSAFCPGPEAAAVTTEQTFGMASMGMSNARQEFGEFISLANPVKHQNIGLANLAHAGATANDWPDKRC